jgi:amino acid adenylation domain-containing protein
MVNDSAPLLVLTQSSVAEQLPTLDVPVLRLDVDLPVLTRRLPGTRPSVPALQPSHLAYLIYTSGSTGEPKAVMVEHRQLCHLAAAQAAVFGDLAGARVLQFASPSFDASVWEWAMALLSGGTLCLAPRHRLLPGEPLLSTLRDQAITHATLPGSALQTLGDAELPQLRTLVVAGEACPVALAERWRGRLSFYNAYGPTEGTVCASIERCVDAHDRMVPIGRPLPNTKLHVLDARGEVVPVGVVGEIYLGGANIARGYWGREALTAERFVADRIGGVAGERLYRTGDLGRYRADGRLECLGRVDFQVKLRGHRIEIGEIETQLEALPGVAEAAVLLLGEGADARLVAYWTSAGEEAESAASLRAQLASRLPDYMLPSSLVTMAELPRTSNGKLDRAALPTTQAGAVAQREYEAPQGEVEEALARLWQDLLDVPRVGRHDHFFELGGHSLLAVTLVERLRQQAWGADVRGLFVTPTLAAYAATLAPAVPAAEVQAQRLQGIPAGTTHITPDLLPLVDMTQAQIDRIAETVPGGATNIQDICPLLPMQTGMLFHHLLEQDGDPYLSCTVIAFAQRARLDDFVRIFNRLIARHDILRISLAWEGLAQPVQVIWREAHLPVHALEVPEGEDALAVLQARTDRRLRLDLKCAPLLAAYVVHDRVRDEWLLGFVSHHLIVDHRSLEVLMGELHRCLLDETAALPPSLPLREQVAAAIAVPAEAHERYFREQLGDVDEPTAPFGILDVQQGAGVLAIDQRFLAPERARRVRELARQHQVPAAVLFHVAYALLLGPCSGRDDVVFGTVLAGRMHGADGADTAMGMFVNTLPLRVRLAGADAPSLLQHCYRELTHLFDHEQAPLALAQRMSGVPAGRPLFTALLNYRHNATPDSGQADDAPTGIRIVADYGDHANYPLTLKINDFGDDFGITAECADGIDATRMLDYLERALDGLLQALDSDGALDGFSLSSEAEQRQLVEGFNDTHREYPRDSLLHEEFARHAAVQPDAVALECGDERLSYRELDQRANRLAHYLVSLGVGPDQRVAIALPRGIEMVLGMLAVLKAGGAYVPLDPQQPRERLAWLLADTAPAAVLSSSDWDGSLPALDVPVLRFDVECTALLQRPMPEAPVVPALRADHLCYVIYTSGSTGRPKGVMVEHRQVLRLAINNPYCTLTVKDTVAHAANPAFDASTWEVWGALLAGARLLIVPQEDLLAPARLVDCLRAGRVSALWLSVGLFNQYEAALRPIYGQLRYLLVGGDALDPAVMARVMNAADRPQHVVNGYGPTESTTFACTHELDPRDLDGRPIPIGRPIANTRVYILGTAGEVLPLGAAGEIHIGGDGVARGYWNQPERTLEHFLPDPFVPGERMYRSGDRGRYRPDGTIEYLGRVDGQVKIRGFRVETGEIEMALRALPGIGEAAVLVHVPEGGEKSLVAYVVPVDAGADQEQVHAWREALRGSLPDYMLPSAFVELPAMPLNANGKLDRRALPSPDVGLRAARAYRAPEGGTELALAEIWQQLLEVPRVGRDDDFFALGGHSLLAVTLSVHVQERFHIDLPLKTVFEMARLEDLARAIETAQLALPSEQDLGAMQAELDALSDEELLAFLGDKV